jgi:protease I
MSTKKILMLVGDYVEDYEAMVPLQILTMVGHHVDTVCPNKKPGDKVKTAIHVFEGDQTYSEKPGHNFAITFDFNQVKEGNYDGLVIPGGRAPEYLRLDERVLDLVRNFAKSNKPIAVICHGAQILTAANVVQGKVCSAYPAVKPELIAVGAKWGEPNQTFTNAYVDDNIISAAAWPAQADWMRKFLDRLGSRIEA